MRNARRKLRTLGDQASGVARAVVNELQRTATLTRRSPPRPGNAPPARPRRGRHGWSRCTTPMPARSPRAGSASRSSLGTRRSSSTTKTASSSTTTSSQGTRPTRRCWSRRSNGSNVAREAPTGGHRRPGLRRTRRRGRRACRRSTLRRAPHQRPPNGETSPGREAPRLPKDGAMAHRLRRTNQLLKRDFGLARTRLDGLAGARTWCGHGIFAHNLVKISGLLDD